MQNVLFASVVHLDHIATCVVSLTSVLLFTTGVFQSDHILVTVMRLISSHQGKDSACVCYDTLGVTCYNERCE
jgi:hypothetical protein